MRHGLIRVSWSYEELEEGRLADSFTVRFEPLGDFATPIEIAIEHVPPQREYEIEQALAEGRWRVSVAAMLGDAYMVSSAGG